MASHVFGKWKYIKVGPHALYSKETIPSCSRGNIFVLHSQPNNKTRAIWLFWLFHYLVNKLDSLDIDISLVNTRAAQMLWYLTSKSLKYNIRRTFKCYEYQMKLYPPCAQSLWLKLYKLVWSSADLNIPHIKTTIQTAHWPNRQLSNYWLYSWFVYHILSGYIIPWRKIFRGHLAPKHP